MISNNFSSFLTATHLQNYCFQHPHFPNKWYSPASGSVCWFRHCCRNHFYLFTASASHDEAAFCPQWGLSIRVPTKKSQKRGKYCGKNGEIWSFPTTLWSRRLQCSWKLLSKMFLLMNTFHMISTKYGLLIQTYVTYFLSESILI